MAQPAMLSLRVAAGDPLTIEVTDEAARPVAGATVTFHLGEGGPTVEAHTGADGRAALQPSAAAMPAGQRDVRVFAAKGEARAGIVATIAVTAASEPPRETAEPAPVEAAPARHGVVFTTTSPSARSEIKTSHRWIYIAIAVAAGVGGGLAWRMSQAGSVSTAVAAPVTSANTTRLAIGIPAITVGRP